LKDLDLRQNSIKLAIKIAFKEMPDGIKVIDKNGLQKPNVRMRSSEYIQVENLDFSSMLDQKARISKALDAYFEENIRRHQPESWFDIDRTKLGFQIPFSRIFYDHSPAKSKDSIIPRLEELMDKQLGWIRNGE
jgi:type I restriction enzyme M protein